MEESDEEEDKDGRAAADDDDDDYYDDESEDEADEDGSDAGTQSTGSRASGVSGSGIRRRHRRHGRRRRRRRRRHQQDQRQQDGDGEQGEQQEEEDEKDSDAPNTARNQEKKGTAPGPVTVILASRISAGEESESFFCLNLIWGHPEAANSAEYSLAAIASTQLSELTIDDAPHLCTSPSPEARPTALRVRCSAHNEKSAPVVLVSHIFHPYDHKLVKRLQVVRTVCLQCLAKWANGVAPVTTNKDGRNLSIFYHL